MALPFKPPERWSVSKNDEYECFGRKNDRHIVLEMGNLSLKVQRIFSEWDIELMDFTNGLYNPELVDRTITHDKNEAMSEACRMMSEN